MRDFLLFLRDKSLLAALGILLFIEILLQLGFYKPALKKNSYASNVNRITDRPIEKKEEISPNVLIVGTSIAYEGISLPLLNQLWKPHGLVAQTVAIPGSDLMVQDLAVRKVLKHFPKVKYLIHVNEIQMPWVVQSTPSDPTLSMLGEFNRWNAIQKLREDKYEFGFSELSFFLVRLVGYRRDLGDFFLSIDKRIKDISKAKKEKAMNLYSYENEYIPSMSLYQFQSLDECIEKTEQSKPIPNGSDEYHKSAIWKTCKLVKETRLPLDKNSTTDIYKLRLQNMYHNIKEHNIKIINVFPPLPVFMGEEDTKNRIRFWEEHYSEVLSTPFLILSESIPSENNSDYYYDMIHLNKKGMIQFTEALAKEWILKMNEDGVSK